jgi:hypothetical protein
MIILSAYLTYKGKVAGAPMIVKKWQDDYDFPFDTNDPEMWRKYLSYRVTVNGKPLPRADENKQPYVYRVYHWGAIKGMPSNKGTINFFPGKDENGKTRKLVPYGALLPLR